MPSHRRRCCRRRSWLVLTRLCFAAAGAGIAARRLRRGLGRAKKDVEDEAVAGIQAHRIYKRHQVLRILVLT